MDESSQEIEHFEILTNYSDLKPQSRAPFNGYVHKIPTEAPKIIPK